MIVLICGDREWCYRSVIEHTLSSLLLAKGITQVIHGACRGADRIGAAVARQLGIAVRDFPAEWGKFSKSAGPRRNKQMLEEGKPNLVIAFHDALHTSKGTADMVERSLDAGIEVWHVRSSGEKTVLQRPPGASQR